MPFLIGTFGSIYKSENLGELPYLATLQQTNTDIYSLIDENICLYAGYKPGEQSTDLVLELQSQGILIGKIFDKENYEIRELNS
jgi:hypothetical protein